MGRKIAILDKLSKSKRSYDIISPQFKYTIFVSSYLKSYPGKTLKDAAKAW